MMNRGNVIQFTAIPSTAVVIESLLESLIGSFISGGVAEQFLAPAGDFDRSIYIFHTLEIYIKRNQF